MDHSVLLNSPLVNDMDISQFREHCLSKPGVTEGFPFDEQTLVFKVMGKMFALADVDAFTSINLKCDPDLAVDLRERYECVEPGFHMNKKYWNTILLTGAVPDVLILEWTDHSYDQVVKGLPRKLQTELNEKK